MAFLGKLWPAFGNIFNAVFAKDWAHVLMHTLLYAVLGLLLTNWIAPTSTKVIFILVELGLLVGCLHEGLQILAARSWPGWPPEILDISVDLTGTILGVGLGILLLYSKKRRKVEENRN